MTKQTLRRYLTPCLRQRPLSFAPAKRSYQWREQLSPRITKK
jgi:hypothetical protein